jgi:hypothetical protein
VSERSGWCSIMRASTAPVGGHRLDRGEDGLFCGDAPEVDTTVDARISF